MQCTQGAESQWIGCRHQVESLGYFILVETSGRTVPVEWTRLEGVLGKVAIDVARDNDPVRVLLRSTLIQAEVFRLLGVDAIERFQRHPDRELPLAAAKR